ncbi:DNA polymerase I [Salinarchaeum sp. Harcht-Bsk1]|uniref:type B DNA-directed DNA polymerase n=1 Tax=Salinarchaeum sp. Harcht-Bsk1 TaxID=1333523 RepID=UPI0003423377|nr:type B DNA-directed DNA polymerase [Salinarchaeum sp. Harcht-Bsk1]AGN02012.1 DNA polymerase I [Salinarchaeum sp. Harcht-Bsk1]
MAFTIDVRDDGTPVRWELDPDGGATPTADPDYQPAIYVAARDDRTGALEWLADALADDPKVAAVERVERYRSLRADERSPMCELRLDRLDEVRQVARELRRREHEQFLPGTFQLYDVDLDPGFRYVLDRGLDPTPDRDLVTLDLALPEPAVANGDVRPLEIDGEPATPDGTGAGSAAAEAAVADAVESVLDARDPDVLLLSSGEIVPLLADADVDLGRRPGFSRIAGESTFVSYGQVGYSPARYDVPGRALVNRSNSFLLGHSALAGLLYFVERAGKPLQEIAKDSIGGVLTAIEIRAARQWDGERVVDRVPGRRDGVPAPWQKRQTEGWKPLDTLHAADRGGFTFQPDPGLHEHVHELDFASLYPNVICEYRVSPDTVCCDCHDASDVSAVDASAEPLDPDLRVPELDYSVCPDGDAFLAEVLEPLIEERQERKAVVRDAGPTEDTAADEAVVEAIKWVLVSCFGYQGYRHAKFGRIEVHEAINAHAREIMLTAKAMLEDAGWRIVHGIVDSVWVTAAPDREQRPIREVATEITEAVRIELEYEGEFDWVAFCPRKRASGAALMRYFGRWADAELDAAGDDESPSDDPFKLRGIEARQRSTCQFVADAQRDLLETFDRERAPEPVCDRLERHLRRLRSGTVDSADLAITQRVSKAAGDYEQATRAKAALQRAAAVGVPRSPGQDVEYVVVDDALSGPERVRLAFELDEHAGAGSATTGAPATTGGAATDDPASYDAEFYADRLLRACESLVAPLGWNEGRIRSHLQHDRDATLSAFGE